MRTRAGPFDAGRPPADRITFSRPRLKRSNRRNVFRTIGERRLTGV